MAKGFVHLNGVTYELATPVDDQRVESLRQRLAPDVGQSHSRQRFTVRVDGVETDLTVELDRVWSVAVWRQPEDYALVTG